MFLLEYIELIQGTSLMVQRLEMVHHVSLINGAGQKWNISEKNKKLWHFIENQTRLYKTQTTSHGHEVPFRVPLKKKMAILILYCSICLLFFQWPEKHGEIPWKSPRISKDLKRHDLQVPTWSHDIPTGWKLYISGKSRSKILKQTNEKPDGKPGIKIQGLKSRLLITTQKCNIFLEKMMVGRRFFPFGMVAVQGPSSILGVYPCVSPKN